MRVLIVADPLESLNPASDTSLAIASAASKRGHEVTWAVSNDVYFDQSGVRVGEETLRSFDRVLIRKDPPFDAEYLRLCWILGLEEKNLPILNAPSALARFHEKLVPLEAVASGFLDVDGIIPTYLGKPHQASLFLERNLYDQWIVKPFLGHGGNGVRKLSRAELENIESNEDLVLQPFIEEVQEKGDRRVFFLKGELLGHFVRMPPKGGFISNLVQGGSATHAPLSDRELRLCAQLGAFLKESKIFFAGADFLAGYVSEVNITSPTGIRSLNSLSNESYEARIVDALESER